MRHVRSQPRRTCRRLSVYLPYGQVMSQTPSRTLYRIFPNVSCSVEEALQLTMSRLHQPSGKPALAREKWPCFVTTRIRNHTKNINSVVSIGCSASLFPASSFLLAVQPGNAHPSCCLYKSQVPVTKSLLDGDAIL